ncbi:potassium-transporting ATPase subunit C [Mycolicibacterium sp. 3033]|nr:potassium-transporting ATPase subunit C [Mycolicibacterium aurantiacum]
MNVSNLVRRHWAALRAVLVFTVIFGIAYPLLIWLVAQMPGLSDRADGSIVEAGGKPVGSGIIGQSFTDSAGNALPQYFQSRPSQAGDGYDPLASSASNLGPESIVDTPDGPSLLTMVCSRSKTIGEREGVDGSRPFCTSGGVGAVVSVFGNSRVVSVNEPCGTVSAPFLATYEGVRVQCAKRGEDYRDGLIVPIRGDAPADPAVPADAVTASGSGLDPHISPAYADLQVARVARVRGVSPEQIEAVVADHTSGRPLGFLGEPAVNVLELNLALDQRYPARQ